MRDEHLKFVSIGGFGHAVFVFDEILNKSQYELCGIAPAFENEDISHCLNHRVCKNVKKFEDYSEMIGIVRPDVVIISTRLDRIADLIIYAAENGCHIITEKPLALSLEKLEKVNLAVKNNNVKLAAMLTMRSEPCFIAAKHAFETGEIGRAALVNARKSYRFGDRPEWFGDIKQYGGTLGWIGIHAFDMIDFITGEKIVEVAAMKGNFCHQHRPACEDNCVVIFKFDNGGHGSVSVDLLRPDVTEVHGDDWIRIAGTKGIIEARASDRTCSIISQKKGQRAIKLPAASEIYTEFFESTIINGAVSALSEADPFMFTKVCLMCEKSCEKSMFLKINNEVS
ncbi:Inositol 2-dehydrogenase [Limihaloglobus sulfuriphilus]|uniref:Inositol 2-dehydrogenase n=1 Tax=Limihaloglobus sulfuriphilus TaxID=1851148 RepID=A0A1Q2ME72_9BACT|nr:Gfo/Idh/MocA family oxidoreductase [Limihaloglobus sulfuriphilus]AQQ70949.1 Inositol 2-dehydrogenase [Limihaloglobus sulfuriphilus]